MRFLREFDYQIEPFHQYTDSTFHQRPSYRTRPPNFAEPCSGSAPPVAIRQPTPRCTRAQSSGEHVCSRGHLLRAPLPHLQRARKKTSQGDAHTVCARCVHVVRAAGRRARLACLPVCSSHLMSMAAMLHRPADLRATCKQNARHELCAKAGGTATAGTRHAASTPAARLAPRHPRQACRPTFDLLLTNYTPACPAG